jgi:hypothetical protein
METEYDLMATLKWSELSEIEIYLDCPMDQWDSYTSKAKLAFAMQFMMAKRNNPSLTIETAEEMSIKQLTDLSGFEVELPKEETSA